MPPPDHNLLQQTTEVLHLPHLQVASWCFFSCSIDASLTFERRPAGQLFRSGFKLPARAGRSMDRQGLQLPIWRARPAGLLAMFSEFGNRRAAYIGKVPVHPWLLQFAPWLLFVFPVLFASFFGMVVSSAACVILQKAALWAASRRH
jgi:hypothetical protein